MAETEETLVTKIIQTPIAVLFGAMQVFNRWYDRDITEIYKYSRKFRTYFDEVEIAVRTKIRDALCSVPAYIIYKAMNIKERFNHKQ